MTRIFRVLMQAARADVKLARARGSNSPHKRRSTMRIGLLIVAGLALIGFLVVAVILPQMAGTEAKEAAQALVSGAQPAQQQVSAAAEKSGNLSGAGKGVKVAAKSDPK